MSRLTAFLRDLPERRIRLRTALLLAVLAASAALAIAPPAMIEGVRAVAGGLAFPSVAALAEAAWISGAAAAGLFGLGRLLLLDRLSHAPAAALAALAALALLIVGNVAYRIFAAPEMTPEDALFWQPLICPPLAVLLTHAVVYRRLSPGDWGPWLLALASLVQQSQMGPYFFVWSLRNGMQWSLIAALIAVWGLRWILGRRG